MNIQPLIQQHVQRSRPKTAEGYRSLHHHLVAFFGHEPALSEFDSESCAAFSSWLQERVLPSSAKTYLTKFYALLRKAHRRGLTPFNPDFHDELRLPQVRQREPRFLSPREVLALERAACPHETTKQAFLFAVHTGLRLSDIETLRWHHIQHHHGKTFVVKTQVKTGQEVRVPLSDKALFVLSIITNNQPLRTQNPEDKVFHLKSRTTIASDLRAWAQQAGLSGRLTFHMSRHTFVTIMLQSKVDIYTASRFCGHTSVTTTQRYAHLVDSAYNDALLHVNRLWKNAPRL